MGEPWVPPCLAALTAPGGGVELGREPSRDGRAVLARRLDDLRPVLLRRLQERLALLGREPPPEIPGGEGDADRAGSAAETRERGHGQILVAVAATVPAAAVVATAVVAVAPAVVVPATVVPAVMPLAAAVTV